MNPKTYPLTINLPESLQRALACLQNAGGRTYVVGGSVRDALLGHSPKDFDVEVYGISLEQIANALSGLGKTDLVGKSYAVVKLWISGQEYDFAIPRRERKTGPGHRAFSVEADHAMLESEAVQRRDFTINALLYDHANKQALDFCGGKDDLDAGVLRHVSEAFREDPLRVLRAMQFAGRYRLTLHPATAALCRQMKSEFWALPKERVWGEWEKWANRSRSLSHGMRALVSSGWICFFPELNALVDLPQDPAWHPEGDAWTHTLHCLDALVEHTDWSDLSPAERATLSLAVLCHDLGKARCTRWATKRGAKHWISPGHESESIWLARRFLESMKAPKLLVEKVARLVGNHHFLNTGNEAIPGSAALRRLSNRIAPANANQLSYVMIADHLGRPPLVSETQEKRIVEFKNRIHDLELKDQAPKPLLLGRHLIARGLSPGPNFRAILDAAYQAQLEGEFDDRPGAEKWLANNLNTFE